MDYGYITAITLLGVAFAGYVIYSQRKIRGFSGEPLEAQNYKFKKPEKKDDVAEGYVEILSNLSFMTDEKEVYLECNELAKFPRKSVELDISDKGFGPQIHAMSDFIKAGVSTKGRNLELLFKADVQAKLNSGEAALMTTKSGEVLADARGVNGMVIGKGRLFQESRLKSMASGGFQLLSIVVAQSHLSEIKNELKAVNSKLDKVIDKLNDNDISEIKGTIKYLKQLHDDIASGKAVSQYRKQMFEGCTYKTHEFYEKIVAEIKGNIKRLKTFNSSDTFGTSGTYESLRGIIESQNDAIEKYELYLRLFFLLKMIRTQLDPVGLEFSVVAVDFDQVNDLWGEYTEAAKSKISEKIDAIFNSQSTLDVRSESLVQILDHQELRLEYVTHQANVVSIRLDDNLKNLVDSNEYRVALSYDSNGELSKAAITG